MGFDWAVLDQEAVRIFRIVAPCLGPIEYRIVDQDLVPTIADASCGASRDDRTPDFCERKATLRWRHY
jgi:hypothetical protein